MLQGFKMASMHKEEESNHETISFELFIMFLNNKFRNKQTAFSLFSFFFFFLIFYLIIYSFFSPFAFSLETGFVFQKSFLNIYKHYLSF